jgi:predicted lipoprotein with Yx(FWY)xxD motif
MRRVEVRTKLVTCMIAAVLLLGAACGSDNNKSSTSGSDNKSSATTEAASGSNSGSTMTVVKTSDSKLGQILTNDKGMTLYAFMNDKNGMPSCVDTCAKAWPPLTTDSASLPAGLDGKVFKVVAGANGTHQIAAGDWPLYTFANDKAAGDTNGQGIGSVWFVVKPDGTVNKGTAAAAATTAASSGGGSNY